MLIGDFYHVLKPAWISFTVLSLVHPFVNESRKKMCISNYWNHYWRYFIFCVI